MNFDESKVFALAVDLTSQWVGGWFYQEKIRDCRVMWTGSEFITRHGNVVPAPKWFTKGLPKLRIDCGIWAGRHGFNAASAAVRFGGHWFDGDTATGHPIQFVPFDLPDMVGRWDKRQREAARAVSGCAFGKVIPFHRVEDKASFGHPTRHSYAGILMRIHNLGGEGAVFRNPDQDSYETGRTENLLRTKLTAN